MYALLTCAFDFLGSNLILTMKETCPTLLIIFLTFTCPQLSSGDSLASVDGRLDTDSTFELLKSTPGGRLRHGHNLKLRGHGPRLHSNMSRSYKRLLNYMNNGHQVQRPHNTSNLPNVKCTCSFGADTYHGHFIKMTLVFIGLWVIWAAMPLYKGIYRSVIKRRSTCDVYLLVSGTLEFYIKMGTLAGHRLDYVFSSTDEICISKVSGVISCKATLNVPLIATDISSGCVKMFGRELTSDPVSNHLFKRLQRNGLLNYEVVIAFCGGPCYAVEVELVHNPDNPDIGGQ